MAGPTGLQQLLRMQGLEWGDSGRGGGDMHMWFDGGDLNCDANWKTLGYRLATAPRPWTAGGNGAAWGWAGWTTLIKGAETQAGGAIYNELTFSGLTADYAGFTSALNNRTITDTSARNYTGKIRAEFNEVILQTTGGTMTRVEPGSNIFNISAGASGTLTSGYGVAGEMFHSSDTYLVTAFWSVFGSTQLKANGNCTTGYGAYLECLTDADATGTATGTFSSAFGSYGVVTHSNASTIDNGYGMRGNVNNASTGAITTARGYYGIVTNSSSGTISIATGAEFAITNTGTGTITGWTGVAVVAPTVSAAHPITTTRGMRVNNQGATGVTSAFGAMIDLQSGASSQNVNLLLGGSPGNGDWNIYSTSTNPSAFNGSIIQGHTPVAINSTATASAAQVVAGYITSTSAAPTTITLPTGTSLGTALKATQGTIHYLTIDNTAGASTVTVAVAVNGILSADAVANAGSAGLLTIPNGVTGQGTFMLMFSSATAYTFSRIA